MRILILEEFTNDIKESLVLSPLGHPSIEYEWTELKVKINDKIYNIKSLGKIKNEQIKLIKAFDIVIGFIDKNMNIVSPILFHEITMNKIEYIKIIEKLKEEYEKNIKSLVIETILKLLETDDNFFSLVQKYFVTSVVDSQIFSKYSLSEKDLAMFKEFLRSRSKDELLEKYPFLRPFFTLPIGVG